MSKQLRAPTHAEEAQFMQSIKSRDGEALLRLFELNVYWGEHREQLSVAENVWVLGVLAGEIQDIAHDYWANSD